VPNFKSYNQDQPLLLPLNIKDLISKEDIVYVLNTVVEYLDIKSIYAHTDNDQGGCPAYHPRMMLKVLIYAYSEGISSSRKIARRLESDVKFMYLSGMQAPDFRTINNFRKDNLGHLVELFIQVVKLCKELGLVRLGHIAIDGSKLRASAGRRNSKSEEKLEKMGN
jgi:transposase